MSNILVVCATRRTRTEFFEASALGRALHQTFGKLNPRLALASENTRGLPDCYNAGIAVASRDDIVVFIHDDVHLTDFFWAERIRHGLERFDLVGVAGNKQRAPGQAGWAFLDPHLTWDKKANLSGVIGHGTAFPCRMTVFGPVMQRVRLLDGVLLAARVSTLREHAIRFDPRFSFHFYDMDLCRQFEAAGLSCGTIPLSIIHESGGSFRSEAWRAAYADYVAKWGE